MNALRGRQGLCWIAEASQLAAVSRAPSDGVGQALLRVGLGDLDLSLDLRARLALPVFRGADDRLCLRLRFGDARLTNDLGVLLPPDQHSSLSPEEHSDATNRNVEI